MNLTVLREKLDKLGGRLKEIENRLGHIEFLLRTANTEPPKLEKSEAKEPPQKPIKLLLRLWGFHVHIPRNIRNFWGRLVILLTIFGGVATYVATYASLRFDVSVLPYASLDSADPTATRFLITNQGPFSIYNVFYACKFVPPQSGNNPFVAFDTFVPFPIAQLHSHGDFSAFCRAPNALPFPAKEGTLLDIEISYRPEFGWSLRGGELFILKNDHSGNAVWLPVGDMTPRADDLRKYACPTCQR